MNPRRLRKLYHEPIWFVLFGALVIGATLGKRLAHEQETGEAARFVLGRAWSGDPSETRAALGAILGFQVTIVALLLSLNALVIKSAAYQYSARLIPLYVKSAPIRRELPLLVLLAAYILGATRELGLVADDGVRPRGVISIAVAILLVAMSLLLFDLVRTFRFIRVERVLGLVRDSTFDAAKRVRARVERLPLDGKATLDLPGDASALVASESGYIVDVDLQRLVRLARDAGVRTRISRAIGDYVDQGEVIGWVASDDRNPVSKRLAHDLVLTLTIGASRELEYDPALGIRIIVDIANRALSSSANDPYTARQALNQVRSVLRQVGLLPLGDWNVVDQNGAVRVSVAATHLRDLLSVAVGGPLYYGADHPDVLEGLLEVALEAGWVARDPADRLAARAVLERVERLAEDSEMDPERLDRLRSEGAPVRRSLEMDESPAPHA